MNNIDEVIDSFDEDDYDLIVALIPFFFGEAWEEYNKSWHILGSTTKDPNFQFILGERIWDFLDRVKDIQYDLDLVCEMIEQKYGTYEQ